MSPLMRYEVTQSDNAGQYTKEIAFSHCISVMILLDCDFKPAIFTARHTVVTP